MTVMELAAVRSLRTEQRRVYVGSQLVDWRAGRTWEEDPGHGASATQVTYHEDLYVPMDGVAAGWERAASGHLQRRGVAAAEGEEAAAEENRGRTPRSERQPLSWWVARPELPRVVLKGAPGEGKTVFLTRLAAALGAAYLAGAAVKPAEPALLPDLDLAGLRDRAGRVRAPVVVEAVWIANRLPRRAQAAGKDVGALVAAVAYAVYGEDAARGEIAGVRQDLEQGRYVVLIDGWDEVVRARSRERVLQQVRAAAHALPETRLVLTTRAARYTGDVQFAPELAGITLQPLDEEKRTALIERWVRVKKRMLPQRKRDDYAVGLRAAVESLGEKLGPTGEAEDLIANPLLLTAICGVYRAEQPGLPDDRAELCEEVVTDLCKGRTGTRKLGFLEPDDKRRILARLALRGPRGKPGAEEGAKELGIAWARGQILDEFRGKGDLLALTGRGGAAVQGSRAERARAFLDWTIDRTGLLTAGAGGETLRFRHRVFRDYLAAFRLAQTMPTPRHVARVVKSWWPKEANGVESRLSDPAWEDVMCLLPGPLEAERGLAWRAALRDLAARGGTRAGRLLALAASAVVETRRHFEDVSGIEWVEQAEAMAQEYARSGLGWPRVDRLFFLDMLGRLVRPGDHPKYGENPRLWGDPRLWGPPRWVNLGPGAVLLEGEKAPRAVAAFAMAWAPVTVQEYAEFVAAPDGGEAWWGAGKTDGPATPDYACKRVHERWEGEWGWKRQLAHPNRPVVQVSWWEARAYCRWRSACVRAAGNARTVRLPTAEEWQSAAAGPDPKGAREYPWGPAEPQRGDAAECNWEGDAFSPVGAFAATAEGVVDLGGNVWQWCATPGADGRGRVVRGGSWGHTSGWLRSALRLRRPPVNSNFTLGLRLVAAAGTR